MKYLCMFGLLFLSSVWAQAHQLDLACKAEGEELVIEAWMGRDEIVQEGDVTILSSEGSVLAMGKTNEEGIFRWKPESMQSITIEVYAGRGHNQSITIEEEELRELFDTGIEETEAEAASEDLEETTKTPSSINTARERRSISSRDDDTPMKVVLGLVFLLSAVSAWFSYRNSKKLSELEDQIKKHES